MPSLSVIKHVNVFTNTLSFKSACNKFIYTEILKQEAQSKDNNLALLSSVGGYINKSNPSFDPRDYGYVKCGKLIKLLKYLDIEERLVKDDLKNTQIYVRVKVLGKAKGVNNAEGKGC